MSVDCGAERNSRRAHGVGRVALPLTRTIRWRFLLGGPRLSNSWVRDWTVARAARPDQCAIPPIPRRNALCGQCMFGIGFTVIVRSLWCRQLLSISGMRLLRKRRGPSYYPSAAISDLPRVVGQLELQVWADWDHSKPTPGATAMRKELPFPEHGRNASVRPFAALQDRPYERAGSARKRSSAEGAGCAGSCRRRQHGSPGRITSSATPCGSRHALRSETVSRP